MERKIRVVIAKPGLDGHDRGAKIIARALRDAGMEVIYTGLHQTPEQIVETAIQEDADAVGISILSGAHMTLVPRIVEGLRAREADDVLVVVGGTIPDDDAEQLRAAGVAAVFTPGAPTAEIVDVRALGRRRVLTREGRAGAGRGTLCEGARQPSRMRSTESAPGEPIVTSRVGLAGLVKTSRGITVRLLRRRRVGATIWAATERSSSASSGTVSSTERAGTVVQAPPGQTRTAVTESSSVPAPADSGTPLSPRVTDLVGAVGAAKSSFVASFRYGKGSTAAPSFGMHLEVEVVDPLGVAGVAVVGDLLPGLDLGAVLEPVHVGDARDTGALVVALRGEVVVEMDVEIRRAALAVEVEHAAGAGGRRPELDLPVLRRNCRRAPGREDVVPLVPALSARRAEVVEVGRRADEREDDRLRPGRSRGARIGEGARRGADREAGALRAEGGRVELGLSSGGISSWVG